MASEIVPEAYTSILGDIILQECSKITKEKCKYNDTPIKLKPDPSEYKYGLKREEIIDIISKYFPGKEEEILQKMLKNSYILEFSDENDNKQYRSIYMDLFIRSVNLKTKNFTPNYIINPRLSLVKVTIPSNEDRKYRLDMNSNVKEIRELVDLLVQELGDKDAEQYVKIVNEYLELRKYNGLDLIQISMIRDAIRDFINGNHILIEAPTGFGKTEIFLFLILFVLIKYKFNSNNKILILYPRKALALDNMNRIIMLSALIEKIKGVKVPVLLRDGDSDKLEEGSKVRGGSLTCPNKHPLIFKNNRVTCSDEKCEYREMVHILDTKKYKNYNAEPLIIISNIYTIANRLLTFRKTEDINIEDFKKISLIILDEVHVYTDIFGGITSSVLGGIKEINNNVKFIGVSATIPNRDSFAKQLFNDNRISFINSLEIANKISEKLRGQKFYLVGFFEIRPDISWHTYAQLWTILASTYSIIYLNNPIIAKGGFTQSDPKNNTPDNYFSYQNIVFINNVYELRRFREEIMQNISIGEPKDRVKGDIKEAFRDPYYVYLPPELNNLNKASLDNNRIHWIGEIIRKHFGIVFMDAKDKFERFTKIAKGEYIAIASTSSLELGVDYEGVSFILNASADDEVEIVQRLGRAGRSSKMPKITLGIILSKNVPHQSFRIHDENYSKRIIYMLSGTQLGDIDKNKIGLRIMKNAKPVIEFKNLVIASINLYKKGIISDINVDLQSIFSEMENFVEDGIIKSELNEFKEVFFTKRLNCEKIMNRYAKFTKIKSTEKDLPFYIDKLEEKTEKFCDKISKDKVLSKSITQENNENIKNICAKLNSNLEKGIKLADNFNKSSDVTARRDNLNELKKKLREIRSNFEELDDLLGSQGIKHLINYQDEIRKKLNRNVQNIINIVLDLEKFVDKQPLENEKYFIICKKINSIPNKKLRNPNIIREFIFNYSSISSVGLGVEDPNLTRQNIKVSINDPLINSSRPISWHQDFYTILTRFYPFTIVNYSDYLESKQTRSSISNMPYGTLLLGLNLNYNEWDHNIRRNIGRYLSIDIQGRKKVLELKDIREIKIYNLLDLENRLGNPIVLKSKKGYEFYVKLGVDVSYIDYYLRNPDQVRQLANNKGLRYDPFILSYSRVCDIGHGISTDPFDINCPFQGECSLGKIFLPHSCRHWISYSMSSMKRPILPFIDKLNDNKIRGSVLVSPINEVFEVTSLLVFKKLDKVLISISDYTLPIYLNPKIRITLYDTNGLKVRFNKLITKEILKKMLFDEESKEFEELRYILLTKYYIIKKFRGNVYVGVRNLVSKKYKEYIEQIYSNNGEREEFLEFVYTILLHTLAHLLYEFIISKFNVDEDFIDYYYNLDMNNIFNKDDDSIYIYEKTSYGTLKLSEIIVRGFKNMTNLLDEFYEYALDELKRHEQDLDSYGKSLKNLKAQIMSGINKNYYKILQDEVEIYRNLSNNKIRPDLYTFKLYLTEKFNKDKVNEEINDYLSLADVVLENICIDGCSSCVITDYCHYPLHQNLVVSRRLAYYFIKEIFDEKSKRIKSTIELKGNSDLGFQIITHFAKENAKLIKITSAFIDKECLDIIKSVLNTNRNILVELTTNNLNNSKVLQEYSSLIESLKTTGRFKLNFDPKTHVKEYEVLFDSNYRITITTSWNCEKSSSKQNFSISVSYMNT
ncbi:DEAD/DEAH box helicase [Stygiolobus caldivivus]|uniref:DEAD/DEAH box helicase n=1 Tax=Stygiolobus caldivivus TaxID=2824673 RepID=A0A8D5UA59_9CREN|nr:DEAD/DEAH box helicase [Stygiolobus caldivivus]BCU71526.1 hypothetical protein KN1_28230 [Stygiolobus caldivivus]